MDETTQLISQKCHEPHGFLCDKRHFLLLYVYVCFLSCLSPFGLSFDVLFSDCGRDTLLGQFLDLLLTMKKHKISWHH